MATNYIATSNQFAKIRVDTSASLVGSWPNTKYRISWNMRYYCSGGYFISSAENGVVFYFNNTKITANVNYYLTPGQTSAIYASGTLDLALGNARSIDPTISCGVSNGLYPGSGTVKTGYASMPGTATLSAYMNGVTHNSATINLTRGNNPYNYWYVRIYNTSSYLYKSDAPNGNNVISGLSPGTNYTFNVELWGRDGARMNSSFVQLKTFTNGISYIEKDTSFDIGNAIKIPITTYSDSFTHTFELRQGNTVLKTLSFSSSSLKYTTNFSLTAAQNTALYNAIPNALSLNLTATVTTYSGGVLVGRNSRVVTMTVNKTSNAPTLSGFSYKDMHPDSIAKTGNNQWVIQNVSYLQIYSMLGTAKNGASISKYQLNVSDQVISGTGTSLTTTTITKQTQMVLTVIDSRGLQSQYTKTYAKWIPYKPPVVSLFNMLRINGVEESTYLVTNGTFDRLNINGVDKNPNLTLRFRYKLTTTSTWGGWVQQAITISGSSFSYNNIVGLFDTDKNYDVQLEIGDFFGATYALTQLLKAQPELSIRENQVGIGAVPDANVNASLQVKGKTAGNGGSGTSWIDATKSGATFQDKTPKNGNLGSTWGVLSTQAGDGSTYTISTLGDSLYIYGIASGSNVNSPQAKIRICAANNKVYINDVDVIAKINELTYDSGWASLGSAAAYRKKGNTVTIQGRSANTVSLPSKQFVTIGTLPANCRPPFEFRFPIDNMGSVTANHYITGKIETDGTVQIYSTTAHSYWGFVISYVV